MESSCPLYHVYASFLNKDLRLTRPGLMNNWAFHFHVAEDMRFSLYAHYLYLPQNATPEGTNGQIKGKRG
jgi:hypothetical protein